MRESFPMSTHDDLVRDHVALGLRRLDPTRQGGPLSPEEEATYQAQCRYLSDRAKLAKKDTSEAPAVVQSGPPLSRTPNRFERRVAAAKRRRAR